MSQKKNLLLLLVLVLSLSFATTYFADIVQAQTATPTPTPPKPTVITIFAGPQTINLGDQVRIRGAITPLVGVATVTLTLTKPNGQVVTQELKTATQSAFEIYYKPDIEGKWTAQSKWTGNATFTADESWVATFTVLPPAIKLNATEISCNASPTSFVLGNSMVVSGSTTPALSGVNVTLTYMKPDGSTEDRAVISGSDGTYTDTYTPAVLGDWNVISSWAGNDTFAGATSSTAFFKVTQELPTPIPTSSPSDTDNVTTTVTADFPMSEVLIAGTVIGLVVGIVVAAVVAIIVTRKKPVK